MRWSLFIIGLMVVTLKAENLPESKVVYAQEDVSEAGSGSDVEEEFGRAAIHGHYSQAANPHHHPGPVYPPPPLPPFLHHPPPPSPYEESKHGYEDDVVYHHDSAYDKPDVYEEESPYEIHDYNTDKPDYGGDDHHIEYVKPAINKGIRQLEKLLETLYLVKDLVDDSKRKCPEPEYGHHQVSCEPAKWSKCNCLSPATFTDEGRGNCNLGATKMDLKVWCYVENKYGNPEKLCPDSKPSKSKPGYYWSRFACIT